MENLVNLQQFREILQASYIAKQNGDEEESVQTDKYLKYCYIHGLVSKLKDFLLTSPAHNSYIVRNYNWLPKIKNYHLQLQSPLIVVGFAHLIGEDGLLDLLKRDGFFIRQITPDGSFESIDIDEYK